VKAYQSRSSIGAEAIDALGDPRRRQIFEMLSSGPSSVVQIANRLPVTRPAVSQHLRVLKDAGLVVSHTEGTRHIYRLDPRGIAGIRQYFDNLWQQALAGFKALAEQSYVPPDPT